MSANNVPYRRESFNNKEVMIAFDANFNRMDESGMRNQFVGKNMAELQQTIDSVNKRVDSIGAEYGKSIKEMGYFGLPYYTYQSSPEGVLSIKQKEVTMTKPLDIDSLFRGSNPSFAKSYLTQALSKAKRIRQDYEFRSYTMNDDRRTIRRHNIELMKKFTLGGMPCVLLHRRTIRGHYTKRWTRNAARNLGVSLHFLLHHRQHRQQDGA